MMKTAIGASSLAILFISSQVMAGVTFTFERKSGATSSSFSVGFEGKRLRMENPSKGGAMIYDGEAKKLLVLDPATKSYGEMTEEELKAMASRMGAMRGQMEAALANAPPERRKMMEQMMGGAAVGGRGRVPEMKYEATGGKKKQADLSCDTYRVTRDGAPDGEACFTSWEKVGLSRDDFKAGTELAELMTAISGQTEGMPERLSTTPGLPVLRTRTTSSGVVEERLVNIKRGTIPAEKFAAPAGYVKKNKPMGH